MPLVSKIKDKTATIGVIGLGYVGLPLVIEFCRAGFSVTGFDVDEQKISLLRQEKSYIRHIDSATLAEIAGLEKKRGQLPLCMGDVTSGKLKSGAVPPFRRRRISPSCKRWTASSCAFPHRSTETANRTCNTFSTRRKRLRSICDRGNSSSWSPPPTRERPMGRCGDPGDHWPEGRRGFPPGLFPGKGGSQQS